MNKILTVCLLLISNIVTGQNTRSISMNYGLGFVFPENTMLSEHLKFKRADIYRFSYTFSLPKKMNKYSLQLEYELRKENYLSIRDYTDHSTTFVKEHNFTNSYSLGINRTFELKNHYTLELGLLLRQNRRNLNLKYHSETGSMNKEGYYGQSIITLFEQKNQARYKIVPRVSVNYRNIIPNLTISAEARVIYYRIFHIKEEIVYGQVTKEGNNYAFNTSYLNVSEHKHKLPLYSFTLGFKYAI